MALTSVTTSLLDIANSDPVEDIFQQVVGTTGKPQTRDVRPQHSTGGGGAGNYNSSNSGGLLFSNLA